MPQNTTRGYTYPLYTDLMDPAPQLQDLATDVDTDMQALIDLIAEARDRPSVRITGGATPDQSIAPDTDTLATFASEQFDNDNMADLGTDNTRIQLQQSGIYLLTGRISFQGTGGSGAVASLRMNSSGGLIATPGQISMVMDDTQQTQLTVEQLHRVGATVPDNITLTVRHSFPSNVLLAARSLTATKVSALLSGT